MQPAITKTAGANGTSDLFMAHQQPWRLHLQTTEYLETQWGSQQWHTHRALQGSSPYGQSSPSVLVIPRHPLPTQEAQGSYIQHPIREHVGGVGGEKTTGSPNPNSSPAPYQDRGPDSAGGSFRCDASSF